MLQLLGSFIDVECSQTNVVELLHWEMTVLHWITLCMWLYASSLDSWMWVWDGLHLTVDFKLLKWDKYGKKVVGASGAGKLLLYINLAEQQ